MTNRQSESFGHLAKSLKAANEKVRQPKTDRHIDKLIEDKFNQRTRLEQISILREIENEYFRWKDDKSSDAMVRVSTIEEWAEKFNITIGENEFYSPFPQQTNKMKPKSKKLTKPPVRDPKIKQRDDEIRAENIKMQNESNMTADERHEFLAKKFGKTKATIKTYIYRQKKSNE